MAIGKKTRFEVLKRDNFTCQYCGGKPPDAILHVDHRTPVAVGGEDDVNNLITSCADCNLGKSDTVLEDLSFTDEAAIARPRRATMIRPEAREQLMAELGKLVEAVSMSEDELEDEVVDTINRVLRDHSMRLKVFMIGMTKRQIQNIFDLTQDLEEMESYMRSRPLNDFADKDFLRMYSEVQKRNKDLLDMVSNVSDAGYPNKYEDPLTKERAVKKVEDRGLDALDPARRERLKVLATKARQQLDRNSDDR
jgi:hypothetical protein